MNSKTIFPNFEDPSEINEYLHVYLIVNPVTAIVSKLFIDKYNIANNKVLICSLRNADTSIFLHESYNIKQNIFERFAKKFLNISTVTNKFLDLIEQKNKKFILYTSWAYTDTNITPSVARIIQSKLCYGHFYLEEGQLSYSSIEPYKPEDFLKDTAKYIANSKYIFRTDSLGYIGLFDDVFPMMPKEKRILINNFEVLKETYDPKLIGVHDIGITCAIRRLKNNEWKKMLVTLINNMPNGGVIKLHPSFIVNMKIKQKIEEIFNEIAPENISLCPNDVILEIEMLFERKKLIGSISSLNNYAAKLGSNFSNVELY